MARPNVPPRFRMKLVWQKQPCQQSSASSSRPWYCPYLRVLVTTAISDLATPACTAIRDLPPNQYLQYHIFNGSMEPTVVASDPVRTRPVVHSLFVFPSPTSRRVLKRGQGRRSKLPILLRCSPAPSSVSYIPLAAL